MAKMQTQSICNRQFPPCSWCLAALLALAAWACYAADEPAGPPLTPPFQAVPHAATPSAIVKDVRVAGNKSISLEKILPYIHTRAGRTFDQELVDEDVRRLISSRQFIDVKPYLQRGADGVVVIFDLLERPILREVLVVGCQEVRKSRLLKEALLKSGDPADPSMVEKARRDMEEYYSKQGFSNARVWVLEGDKPDDRRAVFVVNEGGKQKVWSVKFIGQTIVSGERLATQIGSKHPFLYLFGGEFDKKKVDEDIEKLTAYYRGLGFFRARIGRDITFNDKGNWATITFIIDEGIRYKVRNVSIVGNKKFPTEQLMENLKLKSNDYFNQASMNVDKRLMQDKYGGVGYVFAAVKPDPRFLEEPGQLDLVYNINEGSRYRVGKIDIVIKGDYSHTQENVVRNRLFFKPGDIVDVRDIRASEAAIKRSGCFETNPTQGNAPKIVLTPPGQELPDEPERREKREVADRAGGNRPGGGPMFRGQSPDDDPPRDRTVNITVDCGRPIAPPANAEVSQRDEPTHDLYLLTRQHASAVARERGQYGEPLPRIGTVETQYSPDAGRVNPASRLDWTSGAPAAQGNPASGTVSYSYGNPYNNTPRQQTAAAVPAAGSAPQAAPAKPAPAYGQSYTIDPSSRAATNDPSRLPGPIPESQIFLNGPGPGAEPVQTIPVTGFANESMTGRVMFGVGVNSDAGLVGSIILDEQNFDWTRLPTSWEDIRNATAWRGAGQKFRLEAVPGTSVSRYSVSFQEPYLFGTNVSLGLNGYYYARNYSEYNEQREGGRVALGYQFTPALSGSIAYRGANIFISNILDPTIPDLAEVADRNLALHGFQVALTNDRRDSAFLATEGYLLEASFEQVIGSFTYPRAELDMRKYFTLGSRPDGSGRQVLTLAAHFGISGDNTPIYDRFYAGGFSSLRGFAFRGASPSVYSNSTGSMVYLGGDLQILASAEYMFPITADDMIRGVVFCDTGTVEQSISQWHDRYRVAPGFGLRICVPAMGPAPIALDFAFPVAWQPGDKGELFSFFVGFGR